MKSSPDLLLKAIQVAMEAHAGQVDKGGEPYILHPLRVMLAVGGRRHADPSMLIAAVLHDVLEDSPMTREGLAADGFPENALVLLDALTRRPGETYQEFTERIAGCQAAAEIKLADLADNMRLDRIPRPTPRDHARLRKYAAAQARLQAALPEGKAKRSRRKLCLADLQAVAAARGGTCLAAEYRRSTDSLQWRCAEGHEWRATAASILHGRGRGGGKGSWCPVCAGKVKKTLEDIQALARARGGECLENEYINGSTKMRFRCAEGHEWETTGHHVALGYWCPDCGGTRRKTLEDLRALARAHGGECIAESYRNNRDRIRWRCAEGHEWEAPAARVLAGGWCPACAGARGRKRS